MGEALESQKEFARAAEIYEKLAQESGPRVARGELYYAAAHAWEDAGNLAKARPLYERVATEFADTPSAGDAEIALGQIQAQGR